MNKDIDDHQVLYLGRWVSREGFRTFVYNQSGQKLVNSYNEYESLISSGLWFSQKSEVNPKDPINIRSGKKEKNGSNR